MAEQADIGALLASIGMEVELEPGTLISRGMLILTLVDEDGEGSFGVYSSDGIPWTEEIGMLRAAQLVTEQVIYD